MCVCVCVGGEGGALHFMYNEPGGDAVDVCLSVCVCVCVCGELLMRKKTLVAALRLMHDGTVWLCE